MTAIPGRSSTFVLLLAALCLVAPTTARANDTRLYPYGAAAGDTLGTPCDDCVHDVTLPAGTRLRSLFASPTMHIANNGGVTFTVGITTYQAISFPTQTFRPILGPFLGDVDTTAADSGQVWFRALPAPASDGTVAVVTWFRVKRYPSLTSTERNTFQLVVRQVTDPNYDLEVEFRYPDDPADAGDGLAWLRGQVSTTDPTGGYDVADISYAALPVSGTPAMLNLPNLSNTNPARPGTFIYRVAGPNAAPTLSSVAGFFIDEGASRALTAVNFRAVDDFTAEGALQVVLTTNPVRGVLTVDGAPLALGGSFPQQAIADGRVRYVHDGSESTTDSFVLRTFDGRNAASPDATISISVTPVNDPPTLTFTQVNVDEGGTVSIPPATITMADPDNPLASLVIQLASAAQHGTVRLGTQALLPSTTLSRGQLDLGQLNYVHDGTETTSDAPTFTISDPFGARSAAVPLPVRVNPVNDPAVIGGDRRITLAEGADVVLANADLSVADAESGSTLLVWALTRLPAFGRVLRAGTPLVLDGTFTQADLDAGLVKYAHDGSDTPADQFGLSLREPGNVSTASVTVNATITPVNDPPVLTTDGVLVVDEGGSVVVRPSVLFTVDPDDAADRLTYTLVTAPAHGRLQQGPVVIPAGGTFLQSELDASAITYVHDGGESVTDAFFFRVADESGLFVDGALALVVTPVNDRPVATDDTLAVDEDGTGTLDVLANDTDADDRAPARSIQSFTQPAHGTVESAPGGLLHYTPAPDHFGTDSFTYLVRDALGATDEGLVTVTIRALPDDPVTVDDAATTAEDTDVTLDLVANDTDPDRGTLHLTSVDAPPGGAATITADGRARISPPPDTPGEWRLAYVVANAERSATGHLTLTATPVNDGPVATALQLTTPEDTSVAVTLVGTDADADALAYVVQGLPLNGRLSGVAPALSFKPDPEFNGRETFAYAVSDGTTFSAAAVVTIDVTPVDDPPAFAAPTPAEDTAFEAVEGTALVFQVAVTDVDTTRATLSLEGLPAAATLSESGEFRWIPTFEDAGTHPFTLLAADATTTIRRAYSVSVTFLDDDADGLANVVETRVGTDPTKPDTDGDTIRDLDELGDPADPRDSDDDDTIDAKDDDSDHDGIPDAEEAGDTDPATAPIDTDLDQTPDYLDTDSDNDTVLDATDVCPRDADPEQADADADGLGDACDPTPDPTDAGDDPGKPAGGCGCGGPGATWLLAIVPALRRRRRA